MKSCLVPASRLAVQPRMLSCHGQTEGEAGSPGIRNSNVPGGWTTTLSASEGPAVVVAPARPHRVWHEIAMLAAGQGSVYPTPCLLHSTPGKVGHSMPDRLPAPEL